MNSTPDNPLGDAAPSPGEAGYSELPLEAGLRALSEELPRGRLRRTLEEISRRLEAGEPVDVVLDDPRLRMPESLRSLLQTGVQTGNLPVLLEQYLAHNQRQVDQRRQILLNLGYSLLLIVVVVLLVGFLFLWVIPQFKGLYMDFDVELPMLTTVFLTAADFAVQYGLWTLIGLVAAALLVWQGIKLTGGRVGQQRLLNRIPVIGPVLYYASLSQFCRLLALLVENRVQLPQAIRVAGQATGDADVARWCSDVAGELERGASLQDAARRHTRVPRALLPALSWDGGDSMSEALQAAGEICEARSRVDSGVIAAAIEPLIILGVALVVGMMIIALFAPLIKLLNALG